MFLLLLASGRGRAICRSSRVEPASAVGEMQHTRARLSLVVVQDRVVLALLSVASLLIVVGHRGRFPIGVGAFVAAHAPQDVVRDKLHGFFTALQWHQFVLRLYGRVPKHWYSHECSSQAWFFSFWLVAEEE